MFGARTVRNASSKFESGDAVLQIRKIGNSTGIVLPKELLARLSLKEGDKLHIVEQTEDGIKLSPCYPKRAEVLRVAREIMDEYRDTFQALAK